jgi:hypothetical protein
MINDGYIHMTIDEYREYVQAAIDDIVAGADHQLSYLELEDLLIARLAHLRNAA